MHRTISYLISILLLLSLEKTGTMKNIFLTPNSNTGKKPQIFTKFCQFNILNQGEIFGLYWYITPVTEPTIYTDSKPIIYKL